MKTNENKNMYMFEEKTLIDLLCEHRLFFMKKIRELSMLHISPSDMADVVDREERGWYSEFIKNLENRNPIDLEDIIISAKQLAKSMWEETENKH